MNESVEPFHPARLSYEDIRLEAEKFLNEYHPAGTTPVPIAEIIEFDLSIDIIPRRWSPRGGQR